jgi:hypothetical protein
MVIDGTNGLTFNNATTQNSGGKVLQVVNATLSTSQSTTSSTFVTTNLTASITPLFNTSKILILISGSWYWSTGSGAAFFTIYRNSTNLEITSTRGFAEYNIPTASSGYAVSMSYLDSPATTSSTSYTAYFRSNASNPVVFCVDGSSAVITLMEIAG